MRFTLLLLISSLAALHADEVSDWLKTSSPPVRFSTHSPHFKVNDQEFTFVTPQGDSVKQTLKVVMDGTKYVGVYRTDGAFDMLTFNPEKTPEKLPIPQRYGWASLMGSRVQLIPWVYGWSPDGDVRHSEWNVAADGSKVTLREYQEWHKKDGQSTSDHVSTLSCDPTTGYVWSIESAFSTNTKKKDVELLNIDPGRLATVWPERWNFDYLVWSEDGTQKLKGRANNAASGQREFGGARFNVRDGGFIAFLPDREGWGLSISREGDGQAKFSQLTCNVWLDQHNVAVLPDLSDPAGLRAIKVRFRIANLPPEAVQAILKASDLNPYTDKRAVMIRIGTLEDFEAQPLELSKPVRGLWAPHLTLATGKAHSGQKCLVVPAKAKIEKYDGFLQSPQLELEANAQYHLECYIKFEGDGEGFIQGDYYEEDHHADARFLGIKTASVRQADGWKRVELDFTAPAWGPNLDLKLLGLGHGTAYFDDFLLKKQ